MCNCGKCSECKGTKRKEAKQSSGYTQEKKEADSSRGKFYKKEEYIEEEDTE